MFYVVFQNILFHSFTKITFFKALLFLSAGCVIHAMADNKNATNGDFIKFTSYIRNDYSWKPCSNGNSFLMVSIQKMQSLNMQQFII